MLEIFLVLVLALLLDYFFGETKCFHPLVGFGNLAYFIEGHFNVKKLKAYQQKTLGFLAWILLVLPLPIIYIFFHQDNLFFIIIDVLVLYLAVGLKSLVQHSMNILIALENKDLKKSRKAVGMMVSRKTACLSEKNIARATVESILENGHDAVIASLFWYILGGTPLVIIHRLANTLDAMWGYKTPQFFFFGWFSARADDLLGWTSAKISALLYILSQLMVKLFFLKSYDIKVILVSTFQQAQQYKSLNGGWAIAAGANALNIKLGGSAEYEKTIYAEEVIESPILGKGSEISIIDIKRSLHLVNRSVYCLMISLLIIGFFVEGFHL